MRRAVSIPAALIFSALAVATLPVTLPVSLVIDALRRRRLATSRLVLMSACYGVLEVAGLAAAGALAVRRRMGGYGTHAAWAAANIRLQRWWGRALFSALSRVMGLRVSVEGADAASTGPLLLLMRHASTADTLLPTAVPGASPSLTLRHVLKRELLWEPCLDIVGHRLPNAFIRRGSPDPGAEIDSIAALARDLGPQEGVVLWPEGTRFTPERRARLLRRFEAAGDTLRHDRAARLAHLLPPRTGGVFALLDAAPDVDVVFGAHAGFEGARTLADLWAGALVGARVRVAFWRCPAGDIPADTAAREAWLQSWWERLDAWVAERVDD